MPNWAWGIAAMLATIIGTGLARRYALRKALLDQPGERRNHVVATPRGGGIAMLVVLLAATGFLALRYPADAVVMGLLALSMFLVGGIGWWDDHRPLSVRLRLGTHALASACLLAAGLLQGWPVWVSLLGALAALALINIWNFMDGIDGIAASQAMVVAVVIGLWTVAPWAPFSFALAGAALGFLCWNFPRARIFMGDVGSGILGIALAWGWMALAAQDGRLAWLLLFPLGPFLTDAGLTLARRILRGERWWQAHSSHSYQLLARRLGAHVPVTTGYFAVSVIGAGIAFGCRQAQVTTAFILPALLAWYMALVIIWRAVRSPAAMDKVDRSKG